MTEAEWLVCDDPQKMLRFLYGTTSNRKQRLFACACCRHVPFYWSGKPQQMLLEMVEQFADGLTTSESVTTRTHYEADGDPVLEAASGIDSLHHFSAHRCSELVAAWVTDPTGPQPGTSAFAAKVAGEYASQAKLVRCVFGNPFCPANARRHWLTATVTSVALGIYDDRAFDRLPILADALEDAGCENLDILDHCRQPGEHVRGCWVVDLVLGKK